MDRSLAGRWMGSVMWLLGDVAVDEDDDDVERLAVSAQWPVHTMVFTPPDWPRMTEGTR